MTKPTFEEASKALEGDDVKEISVGHLFGPSWSNHWVKAELSIPESYAKSGQEVICGSCPLLGLC